MLARAIQSAMREIYPPDLSQYGLAIVHDPYDLDTLFQDSAGTTPVTGVEQPVGLMLDKGPGGYHYSQPTEGSRPTLRALWNMIIGSDSPATQNVTTLATDYTLSFSGAGTITLSGTATSTLSAGVSIFTATAGTLILTVAGEVTNAQLIATNISHPQGLEYGASTPSAVFSSYANQSAMEADGYVLSGCAFNSTTKKVDFTGISASITFGTPVNISTGSMYEITVTFSSSSNGGLSYQENYITKHTVTSSFSRKFARTGGLLRLITNNFVGSLDGITARVITNVNDVRFPYQSVINSTTYDSDLSKFTWYLEFTNHWMVTPAIDASTWDKVVVACGLRKMSDAAIGNLLELSPSLATNAGSLTVFAPSTAGTSNIRFGSKGTTASYASVVGIAAPFSASLVAFASISDDIATIDIRGQGVVTVNTDQGTGNYGNYAMYLGKRGGSSDPFVGRYMGSTVAFVTALPNDNILSALSRYYAAKAGIRI